ncbi:Uncharacterised protein [Ectopseudomonas mendocina]|nr:Uncharacterised protein [Pseudomonas mendocina]
MTTLRIESWSAELGWVEESHWSLESFVYRLGLCTNLKGTELKRVARNIRKKELLEIKIISAESANALIHTLESIGAKISVSE